jgi:hypothetical protein
MKDEKRDGMSPIGLVHEREVHEKVVEDNVLGAFDLLA